MKFSALNVYFSSPSPDPLGSRRHGHTGVKEGYPNKKWLFYRNWLDSIKMVADRHKHFIITCTSDELLVLSGVNIDDLE